MNRIHPPTKDGTAADATGRQPLPSRIRYRALAGGDYVTAELKAAIVQLLRGNQNFVDFNAKECFERWQGAMLDTANPKRQAGARRLLVTAKNVAEGYFDPE